MKAIIAIVFGSLSVGFFSGLYIESRRKSDLPTYHYEYNIKAKPKKGSQVVFAPVETSPVFAADTLKHQRNFKRGLFKRIFKRHRNQ